MKARHPSCNILRLLVGILFCCWTTWPRAEHLPIKIFTSADGLGTSATFHLVRDARGFLWICSRDGLIRFDGYRFITYRIGNDDADPAVYSLMATSKGVYWMNLNRGKDYRFVDKGDATPTQPVAQQPSLNDPRVPLAGVEPVMDIRFPSFEDSHGNLWSYESRGLNLLREVDGQFVTEHIDPPLPGIPEKRLTSVLFGPGSGDSFWVGTNWGMVRRLGDGRMIHYAIEPTQTEDRVIAFTEDQENRLWITRPYGLLVLKVEPLTRLGAISDGASLQTVVKKGHIASDGSVQLPEQAGEAYTFTFADMFGPQFAKTARGTANRPRMWKVMCSSDGRIWITNTGGLVVYGQHRFQYIGDKQGLSSDTVAEIAEDHDGNIWLGSYGGLMRLDPRGLITYGVDDGLVESRVHAIYEDQQGALNVVTDNWNISQLSGETFKTARPRMPEGSVFFWHSNVAMLDSRGDWWALSSKGLYRYAEVGAIQNISTHRPTAVFSVANGLIDDRLSNLYEDSQGDVWITYDPTAANLGLTRWERSSGKLENFTTKDGLPNDASGSAFAEDRAGNRWFGFIEGGLARLRDGRFTIFNQKDKLPPGGVTQMFTDHAGRLWIATSRNGLWRIDDPTAEHPIAKNYTIPDGLTSNNVRCIGEDLFGNIYVGTVRGVNRLSPETGHVKYYGTGDGLAGDFVTSIRRDRNGTMWFGTFSGLSKLTPVPETPTPGPPTLISGLRIAGIDYSISPLGQTQVTVPEQSADSNNLQIDFLSISTRGSGDIRYQYKLEGSDQDWSAPTTQRTVNLANLRPGRYRFLVRALNADDFVSETPASITFRILPPIWQRWWFITIVAFMVLGGIVALDRYRVARARELSVALDVSQNLTEELTHRGNELSRAHRALALDYDVTRILAESATPGEAAPRILKAICEATNCQVGALWYVDGEAGALRCAEVWLQPDVAAAEFGSLSRETIFRSGVGLPGRVWQKGEPSWITDLEKDANFPRWQVASRVGLKSAFAFPILLGSEVIGVGEFFSSEIRERDDEMLAMLAGIGSDIGQLIERKQKEEALRESEDRFRTLAETASDAIITIDEAGLIVFVNPAVEKVFGHSPGKMLGEDLTMLMPEYLRHLHRAGLQRYQETGKRHISWEAVELPGLHQSGREIPLELSFGEFVRNDRHYFTGIVRDISERKQAAEALQRSREERLRELERVRRRIATDLHDDIGSSLTQISIMSEVAQNRGNGENRPALSMIANASRELIDAMSDIVWAINPQKDHLSDLKQRMRRFAADVLTSRNIDCDFRAPLDETDIVLGANIRREVFLIFKETVNNLVKHSACSRATIDFRIADGRLNLRVTDDGKGFDAGAESEGHGLMSIRERTAALGGTINIDSVPGRGTTTTVTVPLDVATNGERGLAITT